MTRPTTLRTPRLALEPVGPHMAEGIWEATRASLSELDPWLPWARTASLEQTRTFADDAVRNWAEGTDHVFGILIDGRVAGTIGLHTPKATRSIAEVGYWIRTERARRGYVTEAGREVIRFGFDDLALSRVELRAGVDNLPSQRVAERLGFRQEGRLRRGCPHPDGGYDCYLYGLLREDLSL